MSKSGFEDMTRLTLALDDETRANLVAVRTRLQEAKGATHVVSWADVVRAALDWAANGGGAWLGLRAAREGLGAVTGEQGGEAEGGGLPDVERSVTQVVLLERLSENAQPRSRRARPLRQRT